MEGPPDIANGAALSRESVALMAYVYHQDLYLRFDGLSITILLLEFCRETSSKIVARTHVNRNHRHVWGMLAMDCMRTASVVSSLII